MLAGAWVVGKDPRTEPEVRGAAERLADIARERVALEEGAREAEARVAERTGAASALEGRLDVVEVSGWWEDAGKHWRHLAEIGRLVEETGANG